MNILFEEQGAFKTATVLVDSGASLQVELASGKRAKVKADHVLLRFTEPGPAALLERAEAEASAMETDFLWQVCHDGEFSFVEFARDYYGHEPDPVEATAVLLRLHGAPMYFHRKGRGRFRRAPADILKAALAGLEKKQAQTQAISRMARELQEGRLPTEFATMVPALLYKPDRNRLETKALEAACLETGLSAPQLMEKCGALEDSHDYHLGRFLFEYFPHGIDFDPYAPIGPMPDLPRAEVAAFSIDEAHTTEIDDAFSLTRHDDGWRVGIHIAAPALGIRPGDDLADVARNRLSTVYMSGGKITMLPDEIISRYTLSAGRECPTVSLYLDIDSELNIRNRETRIERVPIVANLRHHDIEPVFNEQVLSGAAGLRPFAFRDELEFLWRLATVLELGRGKADTNQNFNDYNFFVDWTIATRDGPGHITIEERRRGSPLDKLVSELMIFANAHWGRTLADAGIATLYRAQTAGKARMTTVASAHEGLGVDCYAWLTSPLRRYVDLVNQWQLIASVTGSAPAFETHSTDLLAALHDFELTYAAYGEFQRMMERYWCLRWLRQEGCTRPEATVLRESLVRLEHLPLVLRLPSLPPLARGSRVLLEIEKIDLFEASVKARYLDLLAPATAVTTTVTDGLEQNAATE